MKETELFNKLYFDFAKKVYAYHSACTGTDNAADLTQQTFMNLWRYLNNTNEEPDNYQAWIFRIAINVKNDFLREKKRRPFPVEYNEEIDTEYHADECMTETLAIKAALSRLTEDQREILFLHNMGLKSDETGKLLNLSASAVRSRLSKARLEFKKQLRNCGVIISE